MKKPDESMREILFRGKRADNGEWIYGMLNSLAEHLDQSLMLIKEHGYSYVVTRETVGQYTGMKDKNGMRIFEGDIVQLPELYWGGTAVVRYAGSAFRAYGEVYAYIVTESMTVIGNIYDTPELMED